MKSVLAFLVITLAVTACAASPERADPASDAPEPGMRAAGPFRDASSWEEAVQRWRTPEDVNAWIGARFSYDATRAIALSETQRRAGTSLPIHAPQDFFASPTGVCVDLSRFAVETLRRIDPGAGANYLMIEFSPLAIAGNTLRLHWVASFRRDGHWYFFADSKRPGHVAGPYVSVQQYIDEYAAYRGRRIVAFRELPTWQRRERALATRNVREPSNPDR